MKVYYSCGHAGHKSGGKIFRREQCKKCANRDKLYPATGKTKIIGWL